MELVRFEPNMLWDQGVVLAGHFRETDQYVTRRPNGMGDWLVIYTLDGAGYFRTPAGDKTTRAGEVALLRSGVPHEYGTVRGMRWHLVWAHFPAGSIDSSLLPFEEVTIQPVESGHLRRRIYRIFRRVLGDFRERSEFWNELCLTALRELMLLLSRSRNSRYDPRVELTLHLLSQRMREEVRIEDIARAVGLSPSRLSHLFKENTGSSVVASLNRMRIEQAALLLAHTGRTAQEVSFDVGFSNYNHFMRQFRKNYGVNPSTFRHNAAAHATAKLPGE